MSRVPLIPAFVTIAGFLMAVTGMFTLSLPMIVLGWAIFVAGGWWTERVKGRVGLTDSSSPDVLVPTREEPTPGTTS